MPLTSLFQKQVPLNIAIAFHYMQTSVHKKVYILKQTCFWVLSKFKKSIWKKLTAEKHFLLAEKT